MGVSAFELPTTQGSTQRMLFITAKGLKARGYESSDGFVVKAGSEVAAKSVPSCVRFVTDMREKLRALGILQKSGDKLVLSRDYVFNSPSTAAGVVLGMTSNGRRFWKDAEGKSLKELEEESSESGN